MSDVQRLGPRPPPVAFAVQATEGGRGPAAYTFNRDV